MSKSPPRLPRFLTKRDVADHVGVSTRTVSRWITAGDLRVHRIGNCIRIAEEDAISFTAGRRR